MQTKYVAKTCLDLYTSLPSTGKPKIRSNGVPEWTVLAGLVLSRPVSTEERIISPGSLIHESTLFECVSLATGTRCLPESRLPVQGDILHDSHAEVLARRGLKLWLMNEIKRSSEGTSPWLSPSDAGKFCLRPGCLLHLYISTLPCGDCSTEYLADTQDPSTIPVELVWTDNTKEAAVEGTQDREQQTTNLVRGRWGYDNLGAVRTKPGRADAPSTISMSCSDKIASWQYTGIQGALLSHLVEPIYLSTITMSAPSDTSCLPYLNACRRALWERLPKDYGPMDSEIAFTSMAFDRSKETLAVSQSEAPLSAFESLSWISGLGTEVTVNGLRRGNSPKRGGTAPYPQKTR